MESKYNQWIEKNVSSTYGTCAEVTEAMADAFPELTRVRGHYHCPIWGERAHWWLKTPDGKIVDPTAAQFPSRGQFTYVEWIDGQEEPTGKCPNCGELCYKGDFCCSDECEVSYASYCVGWRDL